MQVFKSCWRLACVSFNSYYLCFNFCICFISLCFSQQTFFLMKTLQRRLSSSSSRRLYLPYSYVFRRSLQDVLINTIIFVWTTRLQDIFKTLLRRLQDVFKTSCQDVFRMFSRHLLDVLQKRLPVIFKTSSRHLQDVLPRPLQDVFKTSSTRLAKTSSRHF